MENETPTPEPTPDEIRAAANAELKKAVERQEAIREARTVQTLVATLNEASERETDANKAVREAIEIVAPAPKPAALTAARTQPNVLADWRYRALPKWQREFRNPEDDMLVESYFRCLHFQSLGNPSPMVRLMDKYRTERADLLVGATGGTDGVFDGTAGELLPLPVSNYIQIALYREARFRRLTRNFTATTGASLRVPLQSTISGVAWKAEAAAIVPDEPSVIDHLNLNLQKLTAGARLSNEIIEDEAFGVVQWLLTDVAGAMAEEEDEKLYGSGAGVASEEPRGLEAEDVIVTMTTSPAFFIPTATQALDFFLTTVIDLPHMRKMFYSLPEKDRSRAVWAGPDSVMEIISGLDDANGRPIFNQGEAPADNVGDAESSAAIGSIFRRPVHNLPGAEGSPSVNSNTNRLYFFVPDRTYALLEKGGVRVEASRDAEFLVDKTVFKFIRRVDGGVIGNNIPTKFNYVFTGGITGTGTPA